MLKKNANYFIKTLELQPHVENGFFKETYRSQITNDNRKSVLTSIFYLIKHGQRLAFRKLNYSDEVVVFQKGKSMEIIMIDLEGKLIIQKIGENIENGEKMQTVIPANFIACFRCRIEENIESENDFCLFACICVPGFHYEDFKLLTIDEILVECPGIDRKEFSAILDEM